MKIICYGKEITVEECRAKAERIKARAAKIAQIDFNAMSDEELLIWLEDREEIWEIWINREE